MLIQPFVHLRLPTGFFCLHPDTRQAKRSVLLIRVDTGLEWAAGPREAQFDQ